MDPQRQRITFGEAKLFIRGQWVEAGPPLEVKDKYTGDLIGTVPTARPQDVETAVTAAVEGAGEMAEMPAHKRSELLLQARDRIAQRKEEFSQLIAAEAGKALKWARIEVDRALNTFTFAAEEAKRIHGETVPLDAVPAGEGYFGFYIRRPVGVVAAITPFNFPLNLVAHKVAPALAAGNAVVLKPASSTPLTSVLLCRVLDEAGFPPGAVHLVVGSGAEVGEPLAKDPRVAKISFTGSAAVGERLTQIAGIKKITLELGNTSPVIVDENVSDMESIAKKCAVGAYYNSGQVCLSVQRIYVHRRVYEPFLEAFVKATEAMTVGDPLDERTDVGPMISEQDARRIESWVEEARSQGAKVLTGHKREGAVYRPTVLTDLTPEMKVVCREAFAPVAGVLPFDDFEEALRQADATEYGLQAAVFTRDISRAFEAVRRLNFGGVILNDVPTFRADHMPYGGVRRSGLGREGVRYAVEEMTNVRMVVLRL